MSKIIRIVTLTNIGYALYILKKVCVRVRVYVCKWHKPFHHLQTFLTKLSIAKISDVMMYTHPPLATHTPTHTLFKFSKTKLWRCKCTLPLFWLMDLLMYFKEYHFIMLPNSATWVMQADGRKREIHFISSVKKFFWSASLAAGDQQWRQLREKHHESGTCRRQ